MTNLPPPLDRVFPFNDPIEAASSFAIGIFILIAFRNITSDILNHSLVEAFLFSNTLNFYLITLALVILSSMMALLVFKYFRQLQYWALEQLQYLFNGELYRKFPGGTLKDWEVQGVLRLTQAGLWLTSSTSGILFKKRRFKNFFLSCTLRFSGAVGIIFRAQDFENYFMAQISHTNHRFPPAPLKLAITPHIKIKGHWEQVYTEIIDVHWNANQKYAINLSVKKDIVELWVNNEHVLRWNLPDRTDPNILMRNALQENIREEQVGYLPVRGSKNIWFRESYGKIGFRADRGEQVTVSELKVRRSN